MPILLFFYSKQKKKFYFRWHQIVLLFGFESVTLQFDDQLDDEIKLPLNTIQTSEIFAITNVALLGSNNHQEYLNDTFFKVKLRNDITNCKINLVNFSYQISNFEM